MMQTIRTDQQLRERALEVAEQRTQAINLLTQNAQTALYVSLYAQHGDRLADMLAIV